MGFTGSIAAVLKRILTALIAGSLAVGLLWVGKWGFLALWGGAGLLLLAEWHRGEAYPSQPK